MKARAILRRALFPAVLLALLLTSGCHHPQPAPAERGRDVFLANCARCHGPDARGTHPPGFTVAPRDLTDPALQARLDDKAIRETIRYGKGQMPPFGAALSDNEVTDLTAYIRTLRRSAP